MLKHIQSNLHGEIKKLFFLAVGEFYSTRRETNFRYAD